MSRIFAFEQKNSYVLGHPCFLWVKSWVFQLFLNIMDFTKVDSPINDWASLSGVFVQCEYKGEEVRSVDIVDINGEKWQLWLVPINETDQCVIHYWNYKEVSRRSEVHNSKLSAKLIAIEAILRSGKIT